MRSPPATDSPQQEVTSLLSMANLGSLDPSEAIRVATSVLAARYGPDAWHLHIRSSGSSCYLQLSQDVPAAASFSLELAALTEEMEIVRSIMAS